MARSNNATDTDKLLRFSYGNAKLDRGIAILSLPAGFTCPGARDCLARANRDTGKLTDGPGAIFRCYAASQEALYPNVRNMRWHNMDLLVEAGSRNRIRALLVRSLQELESTTMRVHGSGDFFSSQYFNALMDAAADLKKVEFYAYTKSIKFWSERMTRMESIPPNFRLVASRGGRYDGLVDKFSLPEVVVINHPSEAGKLKIDHDDSLARNKKVKKFALLLHATQPKGSEAAAAIRRMRDEGIEFSYTKKR